MTQKKELWYFFHTLSHKKLGPFSLEVLCTQMVKNQLLPEDTLLCQPGWTKWIISLELPIFLEQYEKTLQQNESTLPPVTEAITAKDADQITSPKTVTPQAEKDIKKTFPISVEENPIESNSQKKLNNEERRKHPRATIELKAVFIADKKTFRTRTVDISLGGLQIIDALPSFFLNRKIEVFLSSKDLKLFIRFEAELVANRKFPKFIQFTNSNKISMQHLENWIKIYSDTKIKKSA